MSEKKEKQYVSDNAQLMEEWDWEKNSSLNYSPYTLTQGSHTKVWWICPKGHSYDAQIKNRTNGNGCSYCTGKKALKGYNDLETMYPEVSSEWNYRRNGDLTPDSVSYASNKKVWWKCKVCGGEYETHICNRTLRRTGCRYCSGQAVLKGFNDLFTTNPDLAQEWSEKNEITPFDVTQFSKEKVYWKCSLGHDDYLSSVKQRSYGQGCPICAQQSQTSFPEQALFFYIKKLYPNTANRYIVENKYELDVFIPEKNIAIEYNGYFSHKNKELKDKIKKEKVTQKGICLLVVKEYKKESEKVDADYYIHERAGANNLNILISSIIKDIHGEFSFEINVAKDMIKIQEQYLVKKKERSISNLRPDLLAEWDYEKNGKITPDLVTVSSSIKYYWICPICNKSYSCAPADKSRGSSCPAHRNVIIIEGKNDFASQHPDLLKYWDYESNRTSPSSVHHNSRKSFNWICEKGHRYTSSIVDVVKSKGCPICSNKRVLFGYNDLLSQNPELAKEWDYELNSIQPSEIYYKSQKPSVHWICSKCGQKWTSNVCPRTECPNCKKQKLAINVYYITDYSYYGTFASSRELCDHFGISYNKQHGNISAICNRKQKSLFGKYILRHPYDDEFSQKTHKI